MASTPAGTTGASCCRSSFSSLWFCVETRLPRGGLARHGAYLEAPEPPDVPAPLEAGRCQPLVQAALQGAQARGTGTDDGYCLGSHVPRVVASCGGLRYAGEAPARGETCPGACGAWWVTPEECTAALLGRGWPSLCSGWVTELS